MANTGKIKSVEIGGGFLGEFKVDFSEALNCIIGARGTGKTTALEAIRFALSRYGARDLEPDIADLLRENLSGAPVKVTFEYDSSPGILYTVTRYFDEKPSYTKSNGESLEFPPPFLCTIFSTNEIEKVANDKTGHQKRAIIDGFADDSLSTWKLNVEAISGRLSENATRILSLENSAEQLRDATIQLPNLEQRLKELSDITNRIVSDDFKVEQSLDTLRIKESNYLSELLDYVRRTQKGLKNLNEDLNQYEKGIKPRKPPSFANTDILSKAIDVVEKMVNNIHENLMATSRFASDAESQLNSQIQSLEKVQTKQKIRYNELREKHADLGLQLRERDDISMKVEEMRRRLEQHNEVIKELNAMREERINLIEQLTKEISNITHERSKIARMITESSVNDSKGNPAIRVNVVPQGDKSRFRELLQASLQGSKLRYGQIVDEIADRLSPKQFAQLLREQNTVEISKLLEIDESRATTVITHLQAQPDTLLQFETLHLDDNVAIELNISQDSTNPEYKDTTNLSTGQKCTAILPIVLLANNMGPLLIDQPENNLDNQYIFKDIIPRLVSIKHSRQIVFITHNPNIPVLGEAEKVIVLRAQAGDNGVTGNVAKVGDVDQTREEIISLLEGGREAFDMRAKKYSK